MRGRFFLGDDWKEFDSPIDEDRCLQEILCMLYVPMMDGLDYVTIGTNDHDFDRSSGHTDGLTVATNLDFFKLRRGNS